MENMVSIFAEKNFLGSIVRGKQIADYLGWKYRPAERDGMCVFLKPKSLDKVKDGDWVDVSDGEYVMDLLKTRPGINVIAHSLYSYNFLKELPNKLVWISQQHLNWDRTTKEVEEIKVCGYIGGPSEQTRKQYDKIGKSLIDAGFEFLPCFDFTTRESCVEFYKKIDCLVIGESLQNPYKTPTKIINAASFGIPSVAFPLKSYEEWIDYTPCLSDDKIVETVNSLQFHPNELIEKAEFYHISNVAKRYEVINNNTSI